MNRFFAITLLASSILTGCASSTTQADFDCPVQDGIPACLNTSDVDNMAPVPKSVEVASDPQNALNVETSLTTSNESIVPIIKQEKKMVTKEDTTYQVKPLIYQPTRLHGTTERMWFSSYEDTKNDLYVDQQFIYWTEKGQWTIGQE